MFSKDITGSDAFREMPPSSQALYFHLGMDADDDGFLDNYKGLMRSMNASTDDLSILLAKRFLILFPSKVIVVKHWKINNTIRGDRYNETKHLEEKRALIVKENGSYTELATTGIPVGNQLATQKRIGKDRKEEDRKGKDIYASDEAISAFQRMWASYPKKELKKKSSEVWVRKNLTPFVEEILVFIEAAKKTDRWKKGFVKQLPAFLNGECWNDDLNAYNDKYAKNKSNNAIDAEEGKYASL